MEGLQVLNRARTPEVEGVLTDADIARGVALTWRDMGEFVFDDRALSQGLASSGRLDLLAQPSLKALVLCNGDRASMAEFCGRALRAHGTAIAQVGIEFDDTAERKMLHLSLGAFDRSVAEVQLEGRLRKQVAVVRLPRFTHNLAAPAEHVVDEPTVDVSPIDQQLVDGDALPLHVDRQGWHGFVLGAIRGRDGARQDQPAIDIRGEMPLEAIEPLALALAAMTHVCIRDRDASIFGDAIANAPPAALGIRLQILRADLHERLEMFLERRLGDFLGQAARDPHLQRVQLTQERLDRLSLLDRVVPVDIERPLDTRLQEQGNARLRTHALVGPPEQAGRTPDDAARR